MSPWRPHLYLLLYLSTLLTTTPAGAGSVITLPQTSTNQIPTPLSIKLHPAGSELLRSRSVQFDILQAMAALTNSDLNAPCPSHREYITPGHFDDVVISIINGREPKMLNKHALWALSMIGVAMATDIDIGYRNRIFSVEWNRQVKGRILVFRREIPPEMSEGDRVLDIKRPRNAVALAANEKDDSRAIDRDGQKPTSVAAMAEARVSDGKGGMSYETGSLRVTNLLNNAVPLSLTEILIPFQRAVVMCATQKREEVVRERITFFDPDLSMHFDYGPFFKMGGGKNGKVKGKGKGKMMVGAGMEWTYQEAVLALLLSGRMFAEKEEWVETTFVVEKEGERVGIGSAWKLPVGKGE